MAEPSTEMAALSTIEFMLNGEKVSLPFEPTSPAVDVLRVGLGRTGTKEGCGVGECGSCTVLVDDKPMLSCLLLAIELNGKRVTTIESTQDPDVNRMRKSFLDEMAVQCGFCTPGMILVSSRIPTSATPDEIRAALVGNICRCTGYSSIVRAIQKGLDSKDVGGE